MYTILRTLFLLIAIALSASAASEENLSKQLDAAPGGKLVVDVNFGSITVIAGADDKVVLEAHRKIDFGNESKEKEFLANAPITVSKEGNVVTIRAHGRNAIHWNYLHQEMDADYIVRVPKKFEAQLRTDGGSIGVSDIVGDLKAHTSGGRMMFANLEGKLDGETSGGSIEIEDCRGPIGIETSGGHIKVTDSKGSLKGKTSGGHIEVRNFAGDIEVRTSGGHLELEKISGALVGKTSGGGIRASIPGVVVGDVKLETSAGSIDLSVPASAGLNIDASTSVGEVVSHLPFQTTLADREHLRGTLNGGGKSVRLGTSVGNITITPAAGEVANR